MYTERDLSLGAFSFSGLLQKAQTAVQKIESAAKSVKTSAEQFLPPESVQTIQAPAPASSTGAVPISQAQASATSLLPSGIPVIPIVLGGAALAFFLLKRRKK